jgi:hypothetical protein
MYLVPLENSAQCRATQLVFYKLMQKSSVLSKLEATFTISSAGGIFIQHMLFIERQCAVLPRYIDFDFNVSIY